MKIINDLKKDIIFTQELRGKKFTFHSTWGLFSPERIDEGSKLLIENLELQSSDTILDLGCGYGAIGLAAAYLVQNGEVHMVDKDFVAIQYAKKNAEINNISNTTIYLSNIFDEVPDIQFDCIISNLPAKVSKELFLILFSDAKEYLKPNGRIYVVTLSGLKEFIKRSLNEIFGNYEKIAQNKTYTVFRNEFTFSR